MAYKLYGNGPINFPVDDKRQHVEIIGSELGDRNALFRIDLWNMVARVQEGLVAPTTVLRLK